MTQDDLATVIDITPGQGIMEHYEKVFGPFPEPYDGTDMERDIIHLIDETYRTRWRSVEEELPECGKPVIGYNQKWIDRDFNKKGTRECFTYDDGTFWQTAEWVPDVDFYRTTTEDNPTHWREI